MIVLSGLVPFIRYVLCNKCVTKGANDANNMAMCDQGIQGYLDLNIDWPVQYATQGQYYPGIVPAVLCNNREYKFLSVVQKRCDTQTAANVSRAILRFQII